MGQPTTNGVPAAAPRFYVTPRQRLSLSSILLAVLLAAGSLSAGLYGLSHSRYRRLVGGGEDTTRCGSGATPCEDKDANDDPSQLDTIYLGDPADAPHPGRPSNHVSPVHPFVIVRLPRFGNQVGLIPDTPAGRKLYAWLAAFNRADAAALAKALPDPPPGVPSSARDATVAEQMQIRKTSLGYNLLSAKEVQPGVLVFRLRDQTPEANEVLGSLQVVPKSDPPVLATFSLRDVPPTAPGSSPESIPVPPNESWLSKLRDRFLR